MGGGAGKGLEKVLGVVVEACCSAQGAKARGCSARLLLGLLCTTACLSFSLNPDMLTDDTQEFDGADQASWLCRPSTTALTYMSSFLGNCHSGHTPAPHAASPNTLCAQEFDGGSRGNPGAAGYGAVLREGDTGLLVGGCSCRQGAG